MGNIFERCFKGIRERIAKPQQQIILIDLKKAKVESPMLYKAFSGLDDDSSNNLSALNDIVTHFGLSIHNADSRVVDTETAKISYRYDTVIQPDSAMSKGQIVEAVSKFKNLLSNDEKLRDHLNKSVKWEKWSNQYRAIELLLDNNTTENRLSAYVRPELTHAVEEVYTTLTTEKNT